MYRKDDNTMTKLESMICEAENNGEIVRDTRDIILNVLRENAALTRYSMKAQEEITRLEQRKEKLENLRELYIREGKPERLLDEINKKIKDVDDEIECKYGIRRLGAALDALDMENKQHQEFMGMPPISIAGETECSK